MRRKSLFVLIVGLTLLIACGSRQNERQADKPAKTFRWKMVSTWSSGLLFHNFAEHFCESVRAVTGGRLDISLYEAGAIVPAMEAFDAVSRGTVQCGHAWPGYWRGKNEATTLFGSVPYGLDAEGYNIWLYERGGLDLWNQLYAQYNMVVFPCGNGGQELGLFSNRRAVKMQDFQGMRIRTVGWYMDILNQMGASVTPMPGGEIFLALERGMIDACEFSAPAINLPMGFHEITKYCIQPGVHQPAVQCEAFINKKAWEELPEDLQAVVEVCARETQGWSTPWIESLNVNAVEKFAKSIEFIQMDDETLIEFRKVTKKYMDGLKQKYPDVKAILESQESFLEEFAPWRELRGRVAPWPYERYIAGQLTQ